MGASGGGAATLQGVPLVRAMWFVKVTILKEFIDKDKNEVGDLIPWQCL